jgi:hypothetical protein
MGWFKDFRKQVRSHKNLSRLKEEQERYHSEFLSRVLSLPGDEEIRRRFRDKYPRLAPKSKGELNILTIYHSYNWEGASLKPSLEKFGSVRHYDWVVKFNHRSTAWNKSLKFKMNEDIVRSAVKWHGERPFDAIFCYLSGELASPGMLVKLGELRIPTVNLSLNDKECFVGKSRFGEVIGMRDICMHFDLCWTSTRDALEKYCVEGALPIYLPEGANPEVHRPYDVEKTFDVTFVGQRYDNRPAVIEALTSAGIRVEAFGPGWPNGLLSTEEMVKMYSRSRISLGFGGVVGHKDTYHLKGRDFEVPMSGGLYLTEQHEELESVYEVGKEIVTYSGIDDLVSKIRWLLSHPEESERIRIAGRERSLREHTWEMRFEKIFGLLGLVE